MAIQYPSRLFPDRHHQFRRTDRDGVVPEDEDAAGVEGQLARWAAKPDDPPAVPGQHRSQPDAENVGRACHPLVCQPDDQFGIGRVVVVAVRHGRGRDHDRGIRRRGDGTEILDPVQAVAAGLLGGAADGVEIPAPLGQDQPERQQVVVGHPAGGTVGDPQPARFGDCPLDRGDVVRVGEPGDAVEPDLVERGLGCPEGIGVDDGAQLLLGGPARLAERVVVRWPERGQPEQDGRGFGGRQAKRRQEVAIRQRETPAVARRRDDRHADLAERVEVAQDGPAADLEPGGQFGGRALSAAEREQDAGHSVCPVHCAGSLSMTEIVRLADTADRASGSGDLTGWRIIMRVGSPGWAALAHRALDPATRP